MTRSNMMVATGSWTLHRWDFKLHSLLIAPSMPWLQSFLLDFILLLLLSSTCCMFISKQFVYEASHQKLIYKTTACDQCDPFIKAMA